MKCTARATVVAVAVISLIVGFAGGRVTANGSTDTDAPEVAAATDDLRHEPHTRAAAVAVAERWLAATDSRAELIDASHRRTTIVALVAPRSRTSLSHKLDAAAAAMEDPANGVDVARSSRLGYRMLAFTAHRAVVSAWEIVARSSRTLGANALWARTRLTLIWAGGWRVSDTRVEAAPLMAWTPARIASMDADYRALSDAR